ncbi:Hypothetical protein R9X50_00397500 [Acrodontium crateriforme]|uniref:Uncharacterized protein n=1 Tax=Acrodontium crateriforme TaxID=150365 RepID=A0AAQ3RAC1_9PEZI|nr:Hypothetical protein R9X50_00397500 [Acrodontium crateriforme]
MHYIRFLKTPKVHVVNNNISLQAVVTVTTDLGETFYPADLELVATLRDTAANGDIYLRRTIAWRGAARSLPISLDLTRQDVDWPACLHVAVKSRETQYIGFLPPVVDVWSGVVNPIKGEFESGWRVERRFTALSERTVSLLEDAGDSIARHLWDGSQALVQHIDQTISLQGGTTMPLLEYALVSAVYRRLNIIELGCGCGSVGISIAQMVPDSDVLLTDLPEVTSLVEANIARMRPAMASKVTFAPLDWEDALPDKIQSRPNDLIIVSECTYNTDTLQPLVQTLLGLLVRSPKAVIVVSTKTRHDSEAVFFDMMKHAGFIADSSMRLPLPGEPGQGYADWATDVGLHVFHGKDHRLSLSPRDGLGSAEVKTQNPFDQMDAKKQERKA